MMDISKLRPTDKLSRFNTITGEHEIVDASEYIKEQMEKENMAYRVDSKANQVYNQDPPKSIFITGLSTGEKFEYKFSEGKIINEIKAYIDSTYQQHYSGKYQATDMIIDAGHGTGFNVGNIMKYAKRYGKKSGYNKKDLLKIIHYAIIQLHVHDVENLEGEKK